MLFQLVPLDLPSSFTELTVLCDQNFIAVSFKLSDYPNANVGTAHLEDNACKPEVNNDIVSFKFGLLECNSKQSESEDGKYLDYQNKIHMKMTFTNPENSSIVRGFSVVFPFMCSYERKALMTGKVSYSPKTTLVITSAGMRRHQI